MHCYSYYGVLVPSSLELSAAIACGRDAATSGEPPIPDTISKCIREEGVACAVLYLRAMLLARSFEISADKVPELVLLR